MAVLISTKVKGQTYEGYDGLLTMVRESVRQAPGFVLHCAAPGEEEWQVTEVWTDKKAADKWFAENIVPNLPPGIHPKRTYFELHSLVTSAQTEEIAG